MGVTIACQASLNVSADSIRKKPRDSGRSGLRLIIATSF
jgi:hypothetical protein